MQFRTLVIDGDAVSRRHLCALLDKAKLNSEPVADGQRGLAMALNGFFDAVIISEDAPIVGGMEFLARLRTAHSLIPIVLILKAKGESEHKAFRLGATACMQQPVVFEKLAALLRRLMQDKTAMHETLKGQRLLLFSAQPEVRDVFEIVARELEVGITYLDDISSLSDVLMREDPHPLLLFDDRLALGEIGRASCRERVCQYV